MAKDDFLKAAMIYLNEMVRAQIVATIPSTAY